MSKDLPVCGEEWIHYIVSNPFIMDLTENYHIRLLPAFHPVITPVDKDWKDLNITFSYTFKNRPYEYHNGGL
jgi:hypothetical protein